MVCGLRVDRWWPPQARADKELHPLAPALPPAMHQRSTSLDRAPGSHLLSAGPAGACAHGQGHFCTYLLPSPLLEKVV